MRAETGIARGVRGQRLESDLEFIESLIQRRAYRAPGVMLGDIGRGVRTLGREGLAGETCDEIEVDVANSSGTEAAKVILNNCPAV